MELKLKKMMKFSFLILTWILTFYKSLMASEEFKEKAEEDLYKQGIEFRNAGNPQMAIECFLPLAKKGYVKAQHNLAVRYDELQDEREAYQWLKRASDQDFEPSQTRLRKMNLLYLLLPDEVLVHVASFLPMKDLPLFKLASHRAQAIVNTTITHTNFLDSDRPYARELSSLFSQVTFEPKPNSIRLLYSAEVNNGSIEVHFRNSEHLRNFVEQVPLIELKGKTEGKLYFVRDENVQDGKELVPLEGATLEKNYFIQVIAEGPIKIKGNMKLPCAIALPQGSDLSELDFQVKGGYQTGRLSTYHEAYEVATMIDTFNEELLRIRTSEAHDLLENQANKRREHSELFPNLPELCPQHLLLSGSDVKVLQKDYISADKPLIYVADSIPALEELRMKLPDFSESIGYIDSHHSRPGIYCVNPLSVIAGFEISTDTHLTMLGTLNISNYNLSIKTGKGLWMFGASIQAKSSSFLIGEVLYRGNGVSPMPADNKPDKMPQEEWDRFLELGQQHGFFVVARNQS